MHFTDLLPQAELVGGHGFGEYGEPLRTNKWRVRTAFDKIGVASPLRAMFFGMGFQETNLMTASQRDSGKDSNDDGSANWSLWNLSEDMLRELGFEGADFSVLNSDDRLDTVVGLMVKGVHRWGAFRFLSFVRGGRTGFQDGESYGVRDFVNAIATHMKVIEGDESLFWDGRRVEIVVKHV